MEDLRMSADQDVFQWPRWLTRLSRRRLAQISIVMAIAALVVGAMTFESDVLGSLYLFIYGIGTLFVTGLAKREHRW